MWSRTQKTSKLNLIKYINTADIFYYYQFKEDLSQIESVNLGLEEIIKKGKSSPLAIQYISKGDNNPDDLKWALPLFAFSLHFEFIQNHIIQTWQIAIDGVLQVEALAEKIKNDYQSGARYTPQELEAIFTLLHQIDSMITLQEIKFTSTLSKIARHTENFVGALLLTLLLLLGGIIYLIYRSINSSINRSLTSIKKSIHSALAGQLDHILAIRPDEDIDDLSQSLHLMYHSFSEQLLNKISPQESEAMLAKLADSIPHMVCILTPFLNAHFINIKTFEYFGVKSLNLEHFFILDEAEDSDRINILHLFEESSKSHKSFTTELRLRDFKGNYYWFLCCMEPITDTHGVVLRWHGSFTNIHQHKVNSIELENAIKSRDRFLSLASHELRTPLTSLILQINMRQRLISKGMFDKVDLLNFQKMVEDDHKQVSRIIRLVDEMLDISRIQSGKSTLNVSRFNLTELLKDLSLRFNAQFSEQNCQLIFESAPEIFCQGDQHKIEQAVTNLLSNALKYGQNKDVFLSTSQDNSSVMISVQDQGEGIPPQYHKTIFELFERTNKDKAISGLGLGLFIVNQIIELHAGSINVTSQEGDGATFTISIPHS